MARLSKGRIKELDLIMERREAVAQLADQLAQAILDGQSMEQQLELSRSLTAARGVARRGEKIMGKPTLGELAAYKALRAKAGA